MFSDYRNISYQFHVIGDVYMLAIKLLGCYRVDARNMSSMFAMILHLIKLSF